MSDPQQRDRLARRTAWARRGIVLAGGAGAVGASVAIGVGAHASAQPNRTQDQPDQQTTRWEAPEDQQLQQPQQQPRQHPQQQPQDQPPSGGLAAPGDSRPSQGRSSGS